MTKSTNPIHWFRHSAPYINTHRGKIFVIMFDDDGGLGDDFVRLVHDIALLHSLGIRLVLVYGSSHQIADILSKYNTPAISTKTPITPKSVIPTILATVGAVRLQLEAQLSTGLANSPMYGSRIAVVSGNFITARPFGIKDGIDHQMTGQLRRIDTAAIHHNLQQGHIVALGPIGFSATGEIFSLSPQDIAVSSAIALGADKLILFSNETLYQDGKLVRELTAKTADKLLKTPISKSMAQLLGCAIDASLHIARTHILPFAKDGALIEELFTRDGVGVMVTKSAYDHIRTANLNDVIGLLMLMQPLEEQGILIKRSKEYLEEDINHYSVIERDGTIVGCVALYPLDECSAELASLAIHPDYRGGTRGADLLRFAEQKAICMGLHTLFALTTHTTHWFIEHGFSETDVFALPKSRQMSYHNGRNSKVLIKKLS
ncbi:amino-acid N-acetyltransferase [Moraxella nasovis]|uniref:amino-acid N-acetyltransferase n=1 Tax=Moraxella nasovis TaxID=2904121 RepID=UPI001F619E62|nr:amino-acid N-acetyltransferase [Moraxella nasovis]UNU72582.1 amino-acid N-acetyltransferase [Moraxella nasovis]